MAAKSPAAASPPRRYITLEDAAERLSCSPLTVRRRIAAGDLRGFKMGRTKSIRVLAEDVDAMMRPIPTGGGRIA